MQSTMIKRTAAVFLIAAVICSLFAGCTEKKPQPEDTIARLQDALNEFDVDGLLQCIDSTWASRIESLLALTIREDGLSAESFTALVKTVMPILPFVREGNIAPDDWPEIEFTVLKTDVSDHTATVELSGILTWGNYTKPLTATVTMKFENDVWVVCGVS